MTFASASALPGAFSSIPSPEISSFPLNIFGLELTVHIYALCLMAGIVVATIITNHRLTKRGAEPWVVIDIALFAVPLAIIGARIFHVATHPNDYFYDGADPWEVIRIWNGGIAIFGALIGGAVGAWIGCKFSGIRFWTFADAMAPGMILAQAIGRFGNWFNQELFGLPTDVPWALEIDPSNPAFPPGLAPETTFHPTFLYEVIWNTLGFFVLLWLGRRFALQWGRLFAIYLVWYGAGRIVWESIRIDPSEIFLGLRTNVWAAVLAVLLGIVIFIVQGKRHPGLEPSPYVPGREWSGPEVVQSETAEDFVDTSAPPTEKPLQDTATSTVTK